VENHKETSQETEDKWSRDPYNWIWGIFYYNKEDYRLLPPKKNAEMGNTINFANRKSVLFFIIAILFFLMIVYLIGSNEIITPQ
jgi:uncharacterized membrane protein